MAEETSTRTNADNAPDFRPELAFPKLTEEMLDRVRPYGREETLEAGQLLFKQGDRQVDMLVVLDGEISISLPASEGEAKVIARHHRLDFTGELNMLNSQ